MEKQITINKIETIKTGTNEKTGKDWTLYKIFCEGDPEMTEFSTFNPDYREGQQMRGTFQYNEKFKNWQEISPAQAKENEKHDEIMAGLRYVFEKLNAIEEKLAPTQKPTETTQIDPKPIQEQ